MKNVKSMLKGIGSFVVAGLIVMLLVPREANATGLARAPYSQSVTCTSSNTNQCEAQFPAVPTGKLLVVQYIAASMDTPTPLIVGEFDTGSAFIPVSFTLQGNDSGGNKIYIASEPFLYYFTAGQQPYFAMVSQSGTAEFMSGEVTLTGYLTAADLSLEE